MFTDFVKGYREKLGIIHLKSQITHYQTLNPKNVPCIVDKRQMKISVLKLAQNIQHGWNQSLNLKNRSLCTSYITQFSLNSNWPVFADWL